MDTKNLTYLVLLIVGSYISIFMFSITFLDHLLMTSKSPIYYSPIEEKVYISLVIITTIFLLITILVSKKYIWPVTSILGIVMIYFLIGTIESYIKFPEVRDFLTDWALPIMFIIPTLLGLLLIIFSSKKYGREDNL